MLGLFKPKYTKWKSYNNNIQYFSYAITPLPTEKEIAKNHTETNAKTFMKQYEDSIAIISKTTNPLTFFYRYDFAIKRMIAMVYMQKYYKLKAHGNYTPESLVEMLIDNKETNTKAMIDRAFMELKCKVEKAKTQKTKLSNIDKFIDSFKGYPEISPDNFNYLLSLTAKLKKEIGE